MVKINIGNGYYLVIGVFIVLVIGVYVFMWIIWMDVYNYYIIQLMKNIEGVDVVYLNLNGGIGEVIGIVVFMVNEGDDVFIEIYIQFNVGYILSYLVGRFLFFGWKFV